MLDLAIKARIPIIAVTTRDVSSLPDVIYELTKKKATKIPSLAAIGSGKGLMVFNANHKDVDGSITDLYNKMVANESSLIIVNPKKIVEPMFNAGEVPVPRSLIFKLMKEVIGDDKKAQELVRCLGGCTLSEAAAIARLTMTRDNSLTPRGVIQTRKSIFHGSNGLTHVDTFQHFYQPPVELQRWVEREKWFFLNCDDRRLIPRGLLFDGPPGVGKTSGAKWLASQLGVPLFRMDIGGTKNKYVGESEHNMLINLSRVDNESPCVVLIDEVEKVFSVGVHDSSGTTTTMLSQLLWWLAERQSRVLVIMTTNNADKLPKELWREGRIDKKMWFGGLDITEARAFVQNLLGTFNDVGVTGALIEKVVHEAFQTSALPRNDPSEPKTVSHAALTEKTYNAVKQMVLKKLSDDE